jgi:hypothetical protein
MGGGTQAELTQRGERCDGICCELGIADAVISFIPGSAMCCQMQILASCSNLSKSEIHPKPDRKLKAI